jgi:hypothetical protein
VFLIFFGLSGFSAEHAMTFAQRRDRKVYGLHNMRAQSGLQLAE